MQDNQFEQNNNYDAQNDMKSIQSRTYSQVNIVEEKPNPEDYIDASYQNGPYADSKRELTDRFCFYAFIFGLIGFVSIFIYSLVNGDVEQILRPFNDRGQQCGVDIEMKDCPYSMAYKTEFTNRIFCVSSCPKQNSTIINCEDEEYVSNQNYTQWEKVCVNDNDKYQAPNIISYQRIYWVHIIIICVLTFYASHFVTDLTQRLINRMLRLITVESLIFVGFSIYFTVQYFNESFKSKIEYIDKFQLAIQILTFLLLIVLFCLQVFIYKYKEIIIVIVLEALRFYRYNQYLIIFTMIICLTMFSVYILYFLSIYYLVSCGKPTQYPNNPNPSFELSEFLTALVIIQSLLCFWIISFLTQLGKFLVGLNSAKWYFRNQTELLSTTRRSIFTCFRFHIGSIALGSIMFQFHALAKIICVLLQVFLSIQQLIINLGYRALNSQKKIDLSNYIYIFNSKSLTIHAFIGSNLFTASRIYGKLIKRSKQLMKFSDLFGELISLDIKLIVANIIAQSFYINSPFGPFTVFNFIISFTISNCVINNWSFGADTILVYYFIDKETNRNEKWTPNFLKAYLDEQEGEDRIQNQLNQIKELENQRSDYLIEINRMIEAGNFNEVQNAQSVLNEFDENIMNAYSYLENLKSMYAAKKVQLKYRRLYF